MKISYKNNKLEKQFTQPKELIKAFGQMSRKVNQRLEELKSADNLSIMRSFPAARCHELTGNRKDQLAIDISGNYRVIFEPDHDPYPLKEDGGLNWELVLAIRILEIDDYH